MSEVEALRDERNHWIGEAKRYERMWRYSDANGMRWLAERNTAREAIERVEALADEWSEREWTSIELSWLQVGRALRAALAGEDAR